MTKNLRIALAATLAATALGAATFAAAGGMTSAAPAPHKEIHPASYELDESPAAMLTFPGNADLVTGTVLDTEPARWNTVDGGPPQDSYGLYYIYTPVHVLVSNVLRGESGLTGRTIVVRRYDGTVGDTTSVPEGGHSCALQSGQSVVLFLQPLRQLNDGRADRVANAAYALDPNGVLVATDGTAYGTLGTLQGLLGASLAPDVDVQLGGTELAEGCGTTA